MYHFERASTEIDYGKFLSIYSATISADLVFSFTRGGMEVAAPKTKDNQNLDMKWLTIFPGHEFDFQPSGERFGFLATIPGVIVKMKNPTLWRFYFDNPEDAVLFKLTCF